MSLGDGIEFSLKLGTGVAAPVEQTFEPLNVSEFVSSFGSAADFDPMFREFVSSFGFSE
jgi:hypothetical protein